MTPSASESYAISKWWESLVKYLKKIIRLIGFAELKVRAIRGFITTSHSCSWFIWCPKNHHREEQSTKNKRHVSHSTLNDVPWLCSLYLIPSVCICAICGFITTSHSCSWFIWCPKNHHGEEQSTKNKGHVSHSTLNDVPCTLFFVLNTICTSVRYKESLREKSHKSSQISQIWIRFWEILNRFVRFLPRRGTTKEHFLLYRTHAFVLSEVRVGINYTSEGSLLFRRGLVWIIARARLNHDEGSAIQWKRKVSSVSLLRFFRRPLSLPSVFLEIIVVPSVFFLWNGTFCSKLHLMKHFFWWFFCEESNNDYLCRLNKKQGILDAWMLSWIML